MYMHFDKVRNGLVMFVFVTSLALLVVCAMVLVYVGFIPLLTHTGEVDKTTVIILVAAAIFFGLIAFKATDMKAMDQYRMKQLIDDLFDVIKDYRIDSTPVLVKSVDGVTVEFLKTQAGNCHIIVRTEFGIQREIYVRRYEVEDGCVPGNELPMSDLDYFDALVCFIAAELDFADMVDEFSQEQKKANV